MCGFLAEFTLNNHDLSSESSFAQLLDLSKHRGPDSTCIHKEESYRLGFNRLAILDLSENGNQPVYSPSKRYHVVFNGELYNFKELIQEYNITDLKSTSDTEVLVHLFDILGVEKSINQLNGMFAIVVVDNLLEKVYMIRDFAGIKPLFYGVSKKGIVVASQFNQVFKHEWFHANLELNPKLMKAYFGLGYMPSPNTIFENIFQVNPGEYLKLDKEGSITKILYKCYSGHHENEIEHNQIISDVKNQLNSAVKRQLASDVPLASFLSGGIDSPLITAVAHNHQSDLTAFTVSVQDRSLDESQRAKAYAMHLGVNHEISPMEPIDMFNDLDEHFKKMGEPFGDYSSLPTFFITKMAKKSHTVMLSGDGGDELFFGYPRMLDVLKNRYWFYIPFAIRKPLIRLANKLKLNRTWGPFRYKIIDEWIFGKQLHILKDDLDAIFPEIEMPHFHRVKVNSEQVLNETKLLQKLRIDEFYGHLQRILIKVDRMSMANSLEVRVPFLDKELIETALLYHPKKFKSPKDLKLILKRLMESFYPKSIISSSKKGFTVPIEYWLDNVLRDDIHNVIFNIPIYGKSLMDSNVLKAYVKDFYKGEHRSAWGVWHIYAWQKWALSEGLI